MTVFLIILSVVLFIAALLLVPRRIILAPAASYLALLTLSFAKDGNGYQMVPINSTILFGWLCMTLVVMVATILQPLPLRSTGRGTGYITVGALAGMAIGVLAYTFTSSLSLLYGIMIAATAAGCFFGFLLYTNTPEGRPVSIGSGNFFKYLLAKGFPIAITVMQAGVVFVLLVALHTLN